MALFMSPISAPSTSPEDLTITPIDHKPNMLMVSWQPPSRPNGRIVTYTIYSNTNNQQPLDSWVVESKSLLYSVSDLCYYYTSDLLKPVIILSP